MTHTHARQTHRWDGCYTDRRVKHRSPSLSVQNTLSLSFSLSCVCSLQTQDILAAHHIHASWPTTRHKVHQRQKLHLIFISAGSFSVFFFGDIYSLFQSKVCRCFWKPGLSSEGHCSLHISLVDKCVIFGQWHYCSTHTNIINNRKQPLRPFQPMNHCASNRMCACHSIWVTPCKLQEKYCAFDIRPSFSVSVAKLLPPA